MSKGGIIVLIVAALVFCGLGFVAGQVVQSAGSTPGSQDDPVVTQSYVDKLVGDRVSALQAEIEALQAMLEGANITVPDHTDTGNDNDNGGTATSYTKVKVAKDSVNIRAAASTSASVVGTANNGDILTYLGATNASDGVWYNVELSDGTVGYIASWLCGEPY